MLRDPEREGALGSWETMRHRCWSLSWNPHPCEGAALQHESVHEAVPRPRTRKLDTSDLKDWDTRSIL